MAQLRGINSRPFDLARVRYLLLPHGDGKYANIGNCDGLLWKTARIVGGRLDVWKLQTYGEKRLSALNATRVFLRQTNREKFQKSAANTSF